jgi:hypothetical protein
MSVQAKSWPELVGKNATEIEQQLKAEGISNLTIKNSNY